MAFCRPFILRSARSSIGTGQAIRYTLQLLGINLIAANRALAADFDGSVGCPLCPTLKISRFFSFIGNNRCFARNLKFRKPLSEGNCPTILKDKVPLSCVT